MSTTLAGLIFVGVPLLGTIAGLIGARITHHSLAVWGIAGFFIAGVAVVAMLAAIPQFAIAARSGIVGALNDALGLGTLWSFWRNLLPYEAWRSIGAIIVPVIAIVVPLFFWQIRKLHIHE